MRLNTKMCINSHHVIICRNTIKNFGHQLFHLIVNQEYRAPSRENFNFNVFIKNAAFLKNSFTFELTHYLMNAQIISLNGKRISEQHATKCYFRKRKTAGDQKMHVKFSSPMWHFVNINQISTFCLPFCMSEISGFLHDLP